VTVEGFFVAVPSLLTELPKRSVFSETGMSGNTPAINIQPIVLRRKRRNVILQPFAIVSRRERERREEGCNAAP
jgi:hypothetical protein